MYTPHLDIWTATPLPQLGAASWDKIANVKKKAWKADSFLHPPHNTQGEAQLPSIKSEGAELPLERIPSV